jgi:hypothetical protein
MRYLMGTRAFKRERVFPWVFGRWLLQEGELKIRIDGSFVGAWLSLVERFVRDEEVAGSNPVAPRFPS